MARVVVLRPEPGASATVRRAEAAGHRVTKLPLFAVHPLDWQVPSGAFDALLLTSANAVRHGGPGLVGVRHLPVWAVGEATATAARDSGFEVVRVGRAGAAALVATAQRQNVRNFLHLAGQERTMAQGGIVAAVVTVYASDPVPVACDALSAVQGASVLLHSARAAACFADHVDRCGLDRVAIRLVAISDTVAGAAGAGWASVAVVPTPDDAAMIAAV